MTVCDARGLRRRLLVVLAVAFTTRVAAQLVQFVHRVGWLPAFGRWQSGAVPYGALLAGQMAIVATLVVMIRCAEVVRIGPRLRRALATFGLAYLATMAIRLAVAMAGIAPGSWFDAPLPSVFHLVLATFLLVWLAGAASVQQDGRVEQRRSIDELLADARNGLDRVGAHDLAGEVAAGALIVDTRPIGQRDRDGEMPGAVVIDRNVLEWRLDPQSDHRIAEVVDHDRRIIVVCNEGYASSLAAATLRALGLHRATDLIGGYQAWLSAQRRGDRPA